ncbi:uncharacterized protein LY89DRAFT_575724 [Mollisia scopiformis]|uniref:Uncharacterized protein n=1 Tax=Mollisia scopiformis TaxID=149040 RepID=A0A194XQ74_MOLSC|nr:uncharacterized protein LY89DRAFT_575724 [Mollisia scopiformis]KUJ22343.1 hypothetical protein LY89DRAFT_575724 [Mollisia scopiformis]
MKPTVVLLGVLSLLLNASIGFSSSAPNPIGPLYPDSITGTINSTLSLVPISYDLARSIIPAQYPILTKAYHSLLPGFPIDKYPLIIRGALDHGVGVYAFNYSLADFQSIHILYPFVDLLGDGYSSFSWNKYLLISANNTIAIEGAAAGGTIVPPTTFDPDLEAYAFVPPSGHEIFLNAYTNLSTTQPAVATNFKNVTNQPIFTDGLTCDNQITLFNSSLSTGDNAPVGIRGKISIKAPYFPEEDCEAFEDVYGIKVDIAFVENPGLNCSSLKGYHATGSGD